MLPLTVDLASSTAPFEQVRTQLAALVAQGALAPGTRLPTVRQLAADLGLAANTVARAYRELEADGVLATYGRRGTFVRSAVVDAVTAADAGGAGSPGTAGDRYGARGAVPDADDGRALGADAADRARAAAAAYVASVRTLGLGVTEATRLVELAWGHG